MTAVGHMNRFRSALAPTDGVPLAAVATDDLDSGIFFEPAGQCLWLSIRQLLDEPVLELIRELSCC